MIESEWLATAKTYRIRLASVIRLYHPAYRDPVIAPEMPPFPITAANTEAACQGLRADIRATNTGDPVTRFNGALDADEWQPVSQLLEETWIGVPETDSCWLIPGFRELVDLLDDLPYGDD